MRSAAAAGTADLSSERPGSLADTPRHCLTSTGLVTAPIASDHTGLTAPDDGDLLREAVPWGILQVAP